MEGVRVRSADGEGECYSVSHVATHEIGVLFTCSITSYTQSSVEESPPTQLDEVCKVCIMCPSDHSQVQCNLLIRPIWLRVGWLL